MGYTKDDVKEWLIRDIKDLSLLYTKQYVKYTGVIEGTREYYYDFIAKFLLSLDGKLDVYFERNIPQIHRIPREDGFTYRVSDHILQEEKSIALSREKPLDEEWLAKSVLLDNFDYIGKIIDYQIPINEKRTDKAGDVDLLAYNEKCFSLIELKRENSTEPMLRAILEISTYFCQINRKTLKMDFSEYLISDEELQKVILVFKDSIQHQDYIKSPYIRELTEKLKVNVFLFDNGKIIAP